VRLQKFGLTPYQQKSWCQEIRKYELRELKLRNKESPLIHSIEDLYYYKSCDIRLMRRLIYRADKSLKNIIGFSDWTEFDLITEVNDDVEDLFEDFEIFNGNRLLFSIYERGAKITNQIYAEFILDKVGNAKRRFEGSSNCDKAKILNWIFEIGEETGHLLENTIQKLDMQTLRNCRVLKMYNQSI
jgi:hypothetical protein